MKSVGEFDDHDSEVFGHRQKHFAKGLRRASGFGSGAFPFRLIGPRVEFQLGDAVHKLKNIVAEPRSDPVALNVEVNIDLTATRN